MRWARRCGQDDCSLQTEARRNDYNNSDDWLQRRNAAIQEFELDGVGHRRSRQGQQRRACKCSTQRNVIHDNDFLSSSQIRPLWKYYYNNSNAIIYVVDSNDRERAREASDELRKVLSESELAGVPLLIFANKQDMPTAMSVAEVTGALELFAVKDRAWFVQGTNAISGDGLYEGLDWLSKTINKK